MQRNTLLRQNRVARNWRQQDLADQLGTTVITIQRWERGSQQPSAYYRLKLCALFGKSVQELGFVGEILPAAENDTAQPEQPGTTPGREIALWTVPYARNPHFTGRYGLCEQLRQHLTPQSRASRRLYAARP